MRHCYFSRAVLLGNFQHGDTEYWVKRSKFLFIKKIICTIYVTMNLK